MRSDRTLRRSSAGARVPSLSFVGLLCSSPMSDGAAGAALLFAAARDNLLEILDVQKWCPPHSETGQGAVNNGSTRDLWRYHPSKTGTYRARKGRQRCQAWIYARMCAPPRAEQTAYLVPAGGSCCPPPPDTPQKGSSAVPPHSGNTSDTSVDLLMGGGGGIPLIFSSHTLVNAMLCLPVDLQQPCHQVRTKFRALNPYLL